MMRHTISILITALLLTLDPGYVPVRQETSPPGQDDKAPSTQAYPVDHYRIISDGEVALLLKKPGAQEGQLDQSPAGRTVRFFALGFLPAMLLWMMANKRRLAGMKAGPVLIRLLMLPLGSHAPPSAIA